MLIVDNNRSEKELVTQTLNIKINTTKFIRSQLRQSKKRIPSKFNSETMDRKRTTSKKENMSFKDFIKESIIDISARRRY